jgi:hypothetical protein
VYACTREKKRDREKERGSEEEQERGNAKERTSGREDAEREHAGEKMITREIELA